MLYKNSIDLSKGLKQEAMTLLSVDKQAVFNDIEMGVLENGMPFLTLTGVAKVCGVNTSVISRFVQDWETARFQTPRGRRVNEMLISMGYTQDTLYVKAQKDGREVYAFEEPVCMALLEYYALDAKNLQESTVYTYRTLARVGFRSYVYRALGYLTQAQRLGQWKHFHDRVDITKNSVPEGYFCVFREIASLLIPMITSGIPINEKIIPDLSVGKRWSKHWTENDMSVKFGARINYEHNFPDYYPQSKSNPQAAYAYPNAALGEFRDWLEQTYTKKLLPNYLSTKVQKKEVSISHVNQLMTALQLPQLPARKRA